MNLEKAFPPRSQLHAIVRFLLAVTGIVVAYAGVGIALGPLARFLPRREAPYLIAICAIFLLFPLLLGLFAILTHTLEGRPLGSVGVAFRGRWQAELMIGAAIGTAMILLVAAVEVGGGGAALVWNADLSLRSVDGGLLTGATLAVAAINEELMFRGYAFQRLVEAIGAPGGVVVSSVFFGLVHLGNPHHTLLSTLNTMLVGVPLAIAYLRTRALWVSIGVHFSWNFLLGYLLGLPLSGFTLPATLLKASVLDRAWLTGGRYGPEASVPTAVVIVLATGYLLFSKRICMSEGTRALVFGESASAVRNKPLTGAASDNARSNSEAS